MSTESLLPSETGWETLEAKSASIHDEKTLVTDSSKLRCYQMPIVHLLVLSLSWNTKKKLLALTADPTPTPGALPSLLSSPRHGHSLWIAMMILITGWLSNPFQRSLARVMADGNSYDFGHLRSVHHVAKVHPFQKWLALPQNIVARVHYFIIVHDMFMICHNDLQPSRFTKDDMPHGHAHHPRPDPWSWCPAGPASSSRSAFSSSALPSNNRLFQQKIEYIEYVMKKNENLPRKFFWSE